MARPARVRNHDFEQKRNALVEGLSQFAVTAELRRTSLRQFAKAVDVSEPTLRHYFKDRQGVVVAILEYMGTFGRSVRGDFAAPSDSITNAVKDYYKVATPGPQFEMYTRAHAVGLIAGIAEDTAGKAYLKYMLEPALTANTEKLTATPGSPKSALELPRGRLRHPLASNLHGNTSDTAGRCRGSADRQPSDHRAASDLAR